MGRRIDIAGAIAAVAVVALGVLLLRAAEGSFPLTALGALSAVCTAAGTALVAFGLSNRGR